ncbi:hypothetical protein [Vibrio pectenicida]|nr:hypothetical protein [Vibrio pectenicida]
MKKKSTCRNSKPAKVENQIKDERPDNIHEIRKKIERILLEREQKKLWDL